jgi:hypothetical protein
MSPCFDVNTPRQDSKEFWMVVETFGGEFAMLSPW